MFRCLKDNLVTFGFTTVKRNKLPDENLVTQSVVETPHTLLHQFDTKPLLGQQRTAF